MSNQNILPARQLRAGNCFFCDPELHDIKLVVGLGNPGPKFNATRHNIGFAVLDELATTLGFSFESKSNFELANFVASSGHQIKFVKPQTFMNLSGQILPHFLKGGLKSEQILVIHDELEKPLSSVALKFSGSARGHNGLKSIIDFVGPNFWRLQFGVGRPEDKAEVSNFVLSRFTPVEQPLVQQSLVKIQDFFNCKK